MIRERFIVTEDTSIIWILRFSDNSTIGDCKFVEVGIALVSLELNLNKRLSIFHLLG